MCVSLLAIPAAAEKTLGASTTAALNLRKSASTSATVLTVMPKGAGVIVISTSKGWSKVMYNNTMGYASKTYLKAASEVSGNFGTGTITGSDVRMRKGAGTSYAIVGTYDKGTKMTITGSQKGWYKVSYKGKNGYVSGDYMRLVPKTSYSTAKTGTTGNGAILRMGPSTKFAVVTKPGSGVKAKVTGVYGSWYEGNINGKYGYMNKSVLTVGTTNTVPAPSEKLDETGYVNGNSVRMRKGPSTSYAIVGYYDRGTQVEITGKTGNWYAVTIDGKSGYMSADYVKLKTDDTGNTGTELGKQIVATAKQYLGTPYVYGGASPKGFDCSGLVYYVYGQYGYSLQRGAGSQYRTDGKHVDKDELQPGDLVFFSDNVDPIGHVGMYIGDGQFIHASTGKGQVIITDLDSYYYAEHYTGAKRII